MVTVVYVTFLIDQKSNPKSRRLRKATLRASALHPAKENKLVPATPPELRQNFLFSCLLQRMHPSGSLASLRPGGAIRHPEYSGIHVS
jgi:hypothetical protein